MEKRKLEDESLARLCSSNSPLALAIAATTGCYGAGGFEHGKLLTDCFWDYRAKRTPRQRQARPDLKRGRLSLGMTHAVGARARDIAVATGALDESPDDSAWDLQFDTPEWLATHGESFCARFQKTASAKTAAQIEQFRQHLARCFEMIAACENEPAHRVPVLVMLARMGVSYSSFVDNWQKHTAWMKLLGAKHPLLALADWYAERSDGKARRAAFIVALTAPFDAPLEDIGDLADKRTAARVSTVRDAQRHLEVRGFYDGKIDGDFGRKSRGALRRWAEEQPKALRFEHLYHDGRLLPWARALMSRPPRAEVPATLGPVDIVTRSQPTLRRSDAASEKPTTPQILLLKPHHSKPAIEFNDKHAKDLLIPIRRAFGLKPKFDADFGYDERVVQRIAVIQKSQSVTVDGKIDGETRDVFERMLFTIDMSWLWPTLGMNETAQYDRFASFYRRSGYTRKSNRAILLGLRGIEPFADRAHTIRFIREYDDTFVLLEWDDWGKRVSVFPGATHPFRATSLTAPVLDSGDQSDIGMLHPGLYSVTRRELPFHQHKALRVRTQYGDGYVPTPRILNPNGYFSLIERPDDAGDRLEQHKSDDGAYATGALFHPGFTSSYRDSSGKERPFSSLGSQTADLEDIETLWELETFDYVLVDAAALKKPIATE